MAKKQGTSYSPNTALIQGAGVAYKNYDNVPGMYAGLDKGIKAGMDTVDEAVKGYEAEQEKIKKEEEEAKAKQEAIEKEWDEAADQVILSSGSLGDKLYNFTTDEVGEDLKKLYLEGVNEKDPKKRREAMRQLQAHSTWVQNHKQMNLDYAHMVKGKNADGSDNPGMSKYFTTNPKGMEEAHTMKQIMDQKYTHTSRDEKTGDIIFHIPADDEKGYPAKTITSKQYNDMVIPRNYSITASTEKLQTKVNKSENLDEDVARQSINNVIDKMSERDFVASMYDDVSGKNLIKMLDGRGENLDQEIISSINSKAWDADKDGILDPKERKNFIDAVTNPENDFFDLETSKKIMADQIFNGVKNRHIKHWERENPIWKQKGYANEGAYRKAEGLLSKEETGGGIVGGYENSGFDYRTETNGDPKTGIQGITQVSYSQKAARRSALLNFETIPGAHYEYRFELDDKTKEKTWKAYSKTDDTFVRNMRGEEVARIEGLQGTEDSSYSVFNVKKAAAAKKEKEDKVSEVSGGAYVGLVNADGASNADAATALNNHFPDMKGRYEFRDKGNLLAEVPTRSGKGTQTKTIQSSKANEVWLYDSETGKPVMRNNKPIIVNTGKSADKSQIQELNNFLADYINEDKYIIK